MKSAKEFLMGLPSKLDAEEYKDISTNLHFDFDTEKYTLEVVEGKANVTEGLQGESEVAIKCSAENFAKLLTGDLNPMSAMMFGKLKVSNPAAMLKYAKMLGIM